MPLSALAEPARLDLKIVQGDSFSREIELKENGAAVPLTGYTAKAQIRDHERGKLLAEFGAAVDEPNGKITLTLDEAETRAIKKSGKWDLELRLDADNHHTIVQGEVVLIPDVTK